MLAEHLYEIVRDCSEFMFERLRLLRWEYSEDGCCYTAKIGIQKLLRVLNLGLLYLRGMSKINCKIFENIRISEHMRNIRSSR